ncbi:SpoIIE family protein phosphatase [Streptomyces sp. NPDC089424]|uniref:SpoIIE family protein phosphatase n=1 Tax=Streptomyces sp. NPDC089424 TaxID=3365917 RepID=UPI00380758F8
MHTAGTESGGTGTNRATQRLAAISVDAHGHVDGWSPGAEAVLGYRGDQVIGRPVLHLVAARRRDAMAAGLQARRWDDRAVFRHEAGHAVELDVLVEPALAQGKSTIWFLSGPSTQTEECDAPLGRTWTQSSAGIVVYTPELRILWANDRTCQLFDTSLSDMWGRRLTEILTPDRQHRAVEEKLAQARDTGVTQSVLTYERVPGETRRHEWVIHIDPVRDRNGIVVALCSMARDNSAEFWARQRLTLLNEARRHIGASLDVCTTARELTRLSVPDLADVAMVHLLPEAWGTDRSSSDNPMSVRLAAMNSRHPEQVRTGPRTADGHETSAWHSLDHSTLMGRALSEDQGIRVELPHEAARWPELRSDRDVDGRGGAMCAPLTARGRTLGVVTFLRHEVPFDSDDLLLVEELAETTAMCIDNARNYEREQSTALTLQQSLLPREPPAQNAVDAAYGYRPADLAAGVGGDWFDVIPLSGARVALVIGDVVGHGVRAAATMGRLRSVVRTLADIDLPPEEVLARVDDIVNRLDQVTEPHTLEPELGASVLYAVYDPTSRRCCLARAAHLEPLLVLPDGSSRFLNLPAGPPLGLGGLPFESVEVTLPEDSLLVFFTDGVVKSRDQDLTDGIARLQACLSSCSTSPTAVCADILAAVLPDSGRDDAALLTVRPRTLDQGDIAHWEVPADPSAVATVRDQASDRLSTWGLDHKLFSTELIVSELVTNAIRYGRAPIHVRLIKDRSLVCEVADGNSAAPHLRRAHTLDEGGRGLLLVAQLASRWGSRHAREGKIIWAEQQLDLAG